MIDPKWLCRLFIHKISRLIISLTLLILREVLSHLNIKLSEPDNQAENVELDEVEDFPFIQIWKINERESLALKEIIRNPDETAIVYIIGENEKSKEFKKRIYEHSYIKMDGIKYHLRFRTDDEKLHNNFVARYE